MDASSRGNLRSLPGLFLITAVIALPVAVVTGFIPGFTGEEVLPHPKPTAGVEVTETDSGVTVALLAEGTSETIHVRANGTVVASLNGSAVGTRVTVTGLRPNETVIVIGVRDDSKAVLVSHTVAHPHNASDPPQLVRPPTNVTTPRPMQTNTTGGP